MLSRNKFFTTNLGEGFVCAVDNVLYQVEYLSNFYGAAHPVPKLEGCEDLNVRARGHVKAWDKVEFMCHKTIPNYVFNVGFIA